MSSITPYIIGAAFLLGLALGIFADHKLHLAAQTVQAHEETKAAQQGEVKIIHDTQIIYKDIQNAKDKCTGAPVPPDINKLLR